jgi:hypothetical protein
MSYRKSLLYLNLKSDSIIYIIEIKIHLYLSLKSNSAFEVYDFLSYNVV